MMQKLSKRVFLEICYSHILLCRQIKTKSINKKKFIQNRDLINSIINRVLNTHFNKDLTIISYTPSIINWLKRLHHKYSIYVFMWIFTIMFFIVAFADAYFRVGQGEYNRFTIPLDYIASSFAIVILLTILILYLCNKYGWFMNPSTKDSKLMQYALFLHEVIECVKEIPDKEFNQKLKDTGMKHFLNLKSIK